MNIKRIVPILIGIVLIAFGVGFYSLRYNDNFYFSRNTNWGSLNIGSGNDSVYIGNKGIEVRDGDDHVVISWDGIKVQDGKNNVSIGWDGIKINEGGKSTNIGFGNIGSWFGISTKDLKEEKINEEKTAQLDDIDMINISSSFVDIKVTTEDRDDVRIHYYGKMRTNVVPVLEVEKVSKELKVKLVTPNTNTYRVVESDVVLEVFVPKSFSHNISITSSSADVYVKNLSLQNLSIATSSGDLELTNIISKLFTMSTSSGDILFEHCMGDYKITTSSGDIELDLIDENGNVEVTTSSGDLTILLGDNANYSVKGTTSSGDVKSKGPISINKDKFGKFEATLGSGKNTMKITTSSGDIEFR